MCPFLSSLRVSSESLATQKYSKSCRNFFDLTVAGIEKEREREREREANGMAMKGKKERKRERRVKETPEPVER